MAGQERTLLEKFYQHLPPDVRRDLFGSITGPRSEYEAILEDLMGPYADNPTDYEKDAMT